MQRVNGERQGGRVYVPCPRCRATLLLPLAASDRNSVLCAACSDQLGAGVRRDSTKATAPIATVAISLITSLL